MLKNFDIQVPFIDGFYVFTLIINNKTEFTFEIPLGSWSIEDYKKQWCDGLSHLKMDESTCIVYDYLKVKKLEWPCVQQLDVFKKDNKLQIQRRIFLSDEYINMLKEKEYNAQSCYEFIKPIEMYNHNGWELLVWSCNYDPKEIDLIIANISGQKSKALKLMCKRIKKKKLKH